jgi:hypothetical protein
VTVCRAFVIVLCCVAAADCSKDSSSATPAPSSTGPKLTAPTPDSPSDGAAAGSFRPALVVRNGTSDQAGTRMYEFQISDRSDFSSAAASAPVSRAFTVVARQAGVPEGAGGTTSYTPEFDLQPTTRLYWRTRIQQASIVSDWSATRSFTTPISGYSRAGELYDPLVASATVGVPVGSTTFMPGKGIRINDGNSYVRYQLAQPLDRGEFSMEVEGLRPNGPGPKLKVFSMSDGTGDVYRSAYLLTAQYRGSNGNPDNCIAFKALLGDPFLKLEPDGGRRSAAVMALDPSHAYFWKGTWSNGFRLLVQDGINGTTLYDFGLTVADLDTPVAATYNPSPHFAYLGANNGPFGEEDGSWPGTIYRNVWIGRGPRPASLGSALLPR